MNGRERIAALQSDIRALARHMDVNPPADNGRETFNIHAPGNEILEGHPDPHALLVHAYFLARERAGLGNFSPKQFPERVNRSIRAYGPGSYGQNKLDAIVAHAQTLRFQQLGTDRPAPPKSRAPAKPQKRPTPARKAPPAPPKPVPDAEPPKKRPRREITNPVQVLKHEEMTAHHDVVRREVERAVQDGEHWRMDEKRWEAEPKLRPTLEALRAYEAFEVPFGGLRTWPDYLLYEHAYGGPGTRPKR